MYIANGYNQSPDWPTRIKVIILLLLAAFIVIMLNSCHTPIESLKSQLDKGKVTRGELAGICTEEFPNTSTIQYIPGSIDTSALIASILKLCPANTQPAILQPDTGTAQISHVIIKQSIINRDSLIAVLKRAVKPDTVKIKEIDSAKVQALQYQMTVLNKTIQTDADTIIANDAVNRQLKRERNVYLFIVIAIAILTITKGVLWAVKYFTPAGASGSVINTLKNIVK